MKKSSSPDKKKTCKKYEIDLPKIFSKSTKKMNPVEAAVVQEQKLIIQQLQEELRAAKNEILELKKLLNKEAPPPAPGDSQNAVESPSENATIYFTDEEELAEETEWIRKKNRKKRKMDTSLSPLKEPTKARTNIPNKTQQPPPILVDGIENFNAIHALITNMASGSKIKVISEKNIKINAPDGEIYQSLTKALSDHKYSWYSFENKQNRPIRVMATKIHHSCEPEKITQDLKDRGFKIIETTQKLKFRTKMPLNMFVLAFRHDEDINKIFNIRDIMGIRVEIQPIKKPKLVPQCKRCQSYGHTQGYCSKEPRCVRCTGKHLTAACEKPKTEIPKCVHCGKGHPASYRGCEVAKEFQKIKNQQGSKKKLPVQPKREPSKPMIEATKPQPQASSMLYSQVAASKRETSPNQVPLPAYPTVSSDVILQQILEKLNKMDQRISTLEYRSQGAIPKTKNG